MTALRKENFNLKLRIYFLEEKPSSNVMESNDLVHKRNIDLKVTESFHAPFSALP